jgi:uncharacterized protein (TIRG00374 family)
MGNLTPGKLGEFVKAAYITSDQNTSAKAITSVILDRVYDLALLFGISYVSMFFFVGLFADYIFFISLLIAISLICIILLAIFYKEILLIIHRIFIPKKYEPVVKAVYRDFVNSVISTSSSSYILSLFLTIFSWVMYFFMLFYLAKAIHLNISFWYLVASVSITTTLTLIPISFNGLGTRDAVLILLFSQIGISKEMALVFSMAIFIMYLVNAIPGLLLFIINPIKSKPQE